MTGWCWWRDRTREQEQVRVLDKNRKQKTGQEQDKVETGSRARESQEHATVFRCIGLCSGTGCEEDWACIAQSQL